MVAEATHVFSSTVVSQQMELLHHLILLLIISRTLLIHSANRERLLQFSGRSISHSYPCVSIHFHFSLISFEIVAQFYFRFPHDVFHLTKAYTQLQEFERV